MDILRDVSRAPTQLTKIVKDLFPTEKTGLEPGVKLTSHSTSPDALVHGGSV